MIKVALPNKGMLFEPTQELLKACGYKASKPYKTLTQIDSKNGICLFAGNLGWKNAEVFSIFQKHFHQRAIRRRT